MRLLVKNPEPCVLSESKAQWTARYMEAVEGGLAKKPTPWNHPIIRSELRKETSGRCAYCDAFVDHVSSTHIEHYRPRAKYPELVVEWGNLTVACPRCNSAKSDKFDEDLPFLNPFIDRPENHLIFVGSFIFSRGSDRATHTIKELELNSSAAIEARERRVRTFVSLISSWHKASPLIKEGILQEIQNELATGEFFATCLSVLRGAEVPIALAEPYEGPMLASDAERGDS